jgi:OOP family OmpA-OmpF porin
MALTLVGAAGMGCTVRVSAGAGEKKPPPPPPPAPEPPPPAPAPKPKINMNKMRRMPAVNAKGEVQLPGPVLFESGTANLKPESDAILQIVFDYMTEKKEVTKLRIEGHTDTDADDAFNQTLSEKRAMAVTQWLVTKGIDCKRLVPVGFGETRLIAKPEKTAEDKARNRRVMFVNAEMNGKPISNLPVDGGGKIAGDPCKK